ncbi:type 1 glutamine amidotransferase [Cellulomonas sp. APG4]|uniref:type 1 glutamine amidotransferase n=1 Tax=Cellulomonas sp. APG4 TaxID=1538656 RepID=UPI00137B3E95|nr:type 1 glutamine amidotransferase [Cellulomonas sp. APG4]NCT90963.1 type 1 glutamine amidotransferase [Cellulomonas sp. APG4]
MAAQQRSVLVLEHVPWERPGLLLRALRGLSRSTRIVLDEAEPDLPGLDEVAGIVVLGGPMAADDDPRFPGLATERRLLAEAVDADVPVLGVCLGMQLLAVALGATLHRDHTREIGFGAVEVVAADPVLAPLGPLPTVLHWHTDAVELPAGATLLAQSPGTPVQAFRAGPALGLQFHAEVDLPLLDDWLRTPEMVAGLTEEEERRLTRDAVQVLPTLVPAALEGFGDLAERMRARAG